MSCVKLSPLFSKLLHLYVCAYNIKTKNIEKKKFKKDLFHTHTNIKTETTTKLTYLNINFEFSQIKYVLTPEEI